ncbi:DEAD/DEAH box helicase [Candidatus Fermentibacteria bacterium]|nr:DEAD/DEAH box helicase [Candidatus Fermentibacteria bacterium]
MSFNQFNLDSRIVSGINRAGYVTPTPIQLAAVPPALAGHDLIGTAQTGTGKTAAFVLPILHHILTGPRQQTRALIVTPTRELAEQVHHVIGQLSAGTGIRSATVYGGVGAGPQLRAMREGVEILVACPGRLLDHIGQGHARLGRIQIVVLDEADRMLDMGFLPDVRRILGHLPVQRQTLLFSATCPPEIERLAAGAMANPKRIAVGLSCPAHTVSHALFPVPLPRKTPLLLALLEETDTESVLVFTRTKHRAQRLAQQVARAGYRVTSLHSDRTQSQRQAALTGFRRGDYQIMVATDIAARGLDVEGISHVVNYDMPNTVDDYIHRIGRTGRAERTGDAYTFVTPDDASAVRAVERMMGQPLPRRALPGFDYAELLPSKKPVARTAHGVSARASTLPTQLSARPAGRRNVRRVRPAVRFAVR